MSVSFPAGAPLSVHLPPATLPMAAKKEEPDVVVPTPEPTRLTLAAPPAGAPTPANALPEAAPRAPHLPQDALATSAKPNKPGPVAPPPDPTRATLAAPPGGATTPAIAVPAAAPPALHRPPDAPPMSAKPKEPGVVPPLQRPTSSTSASPRTAAAIPTTSPPAAAPPAPHPLPGELRTSAKLKEPDVIPLPSPATRPTPAAFPAAALTGATTLSTSAPPALVFPIDTLPRSTKPVEADSIAPSPPPTGATSAAPTAMAPPALALQSDTLPASTKPEGADAIALPPPPLVAAPAAPPTAAPQALSLPLEALVTSTKPKEADTITSSPPPRVSVPTALPTAAFHALSLPLEALAPKEADTIALPLSLTSATSATLPAAAPHCLALPIDAPPMSTKPKEADTFTLAPPPTDAMPTPRPGAAAMAGIDLPGAAPPAPELRSDTLPTNMKPDEADTIAPPPWPTGATPIAPEAAAPMAATALPEAAPPALALPSDALPAPAKPNEPEAFEPPPPQLRVAPAARSVAPFTAATAPLTSASPGPACSPDRLHPSCTTLRELSAMAATPSRPFPRTCTAAIAPPTPLTGETPAAPHAAAPTAATAQQPRPDVFPACPPSATPMPQPSLSVANLRAPAATSLVAPRAVPPTAATAQQPPLFAFPATPPSAAPSLQPPLSVANLRTPTATSPHAAPTTPTFPSPSQPPPPPLPAPTVSPHFPARQPLPPTAPPIQLPTRYCHACSTTNTRAWRTGPDGFQTLCTPCFTLYESRRLVLYQDPSGCISATASPGTSPVAVAAFFTRCMSPYITERRPSRDLTNPHVVPLPPEGVGALPLPDTFGASCSDGAAGGGYMTNAAPPAASTTRYVAAATGGLMTAAVPGGAAPSPTVTAVAAAPIQEAPQPCCHAATPPWTVSAVPVARGSVATASLSPFAAPCHADNAQPAPVAPPCTPSAAEPAPPCTASSVQPCTTSSAQSTPPCNISAELAPPCSVRAAEPTRPCNAGTAELAQPCTASDAQPDPLCTANDAQPAPISPTHNAATPTPPDTPPPTLPFARFARRRRRLVQEPEQDEDVLVEEAQSDPENEEGVELHLTPAERSTDSDTSAPRSPADLDAIPDNATLPRPRALDTGFVGLQNAGDGRLTPPAGALHEIAHPTDAEPMHVDFLRAAFWPENASAHVLPVRSGLVETSPCSGSDGTLGVRRKRQMGNMLAERYRIRQRLEPWDRSFAEDEQSDVDGSPLETRRLHTNVGQTPSFSLGSPVGRAVAVLAGSQVAPPRLCSVKAEYRSAFHRLAIPRGIPFTDFEARLKSAFQLSGEFYVQYKDDEGDYVTISSDSDMEELFVVVREHSLHPLRVRLSDMA